MGWDEQGDHINARSATMPVKKSSDGEGFVADATRGG